MYHPSKKWDTVVYESSGFWGIKDDTDNLASVEKKQLQELKSFLQNCDVDVSDFDSIKIERITGREREGKESNMKKYLRQIFDNIIGTVISLYFIVAFMVFTPYYNWNYAKTNGFIKWVLFGEVVATVKSIAWPYFVFFSLSGGSASHVSKAIDYSNKATAIINNCGPYQLIAQSDMDAIIEHYKKALQEAKKADLESMNKHYLGFGDHFENEFIRGLELFIKSNEVGDPMSSIAAQAMLDRWGNWFSANIDGIRGK